MAHLSTADAVSSPSTLTSGVAGLAARKDSLNQLFADQVRRHPDGIAIWSANESLTYRELSDQAHTFAIWLIDRGIGPGSTVGIALPRSTDAMIAILAAWQAGAAYVPLDETYPTERLAQMVGDSHPTLIIANAETRKRLPEKSPVVVPSDLSKSDTRRNGAHSQPASNEAELGYILFTSGSTGRPKGVAMPRGPLRNLIQWQLRNSAAGPNDATLQLAPLSFDVHFQEVFSTWCSGGTLVLPTEAQRRDPASLVKLIEERQVARLFLPFVMLQQLAEAAGEKPLPLREVITAGEQLRITPAIRKFFAARPNCTLANHYGPTESHVVTAHLLQGSATDWPVLPPIGKPIDGATIQLFDDEGILCPPDQTGELMIGGDCLAEGYVGQPELTAERFVHRNGQRVYRTGDLGQWNSHGELQFLGRIDHQVKIRGFRVEPGEVEAALCNCPGIREAVVVAHADEHGEKRLVAYYISGQPTPKEPDLRRQLAERLPEWMIPSAFVSMTAWPLTPSGKIDRKNLPAPGRHRPSLAVSFIAARTATEQKLAEVWREILQIDEVGIHDPFFDLGGHSLALARVHAKLRDQHGIDLPITALFQHATIAALASAIDAQKLAPEQRLPNTPPRRRKATDAIAVIGMAGRFPGAANVQQFWNNLCAGVESVRHFNDEELLAAGVAPELVRDPVYAKARATLNDADRFDAAFFGLQPREAELTDPQHRLFLESAWAALEDAGYVPERCAGRVGVFAGSSLNTYLLNNVLGDRRAVESFVGEFQSGSYSILVGNDKDYLATRVAYKLNLRGPAVAVQTACSTSLVAICQAVESIRAGECGMAIAGGVSVTFPQVRGSLYQEGAITSPDGHCRPFDAEARGTVFGEGVAAVVLKPLDQAIADGDPVYAVIRGVGLSNDGSDKVSYLAPSVDGQAEAIRRALDQAEFDAGTIGYVEAHGTGTPLGDPIEIAALTKAFGPTTGKCALGSVKGNVGHLEAAAGVTGFIKAALAIHHRQIPPTSNFKSANPALGLDKTPFRVSSALQEWKTTGPRRAGVSSLGVGGTNAHVVLEEAPTPTATQTGWQQQLLLVSARTSTALDAATNELAAFLESNPDTDLADAAFTSQLGRRTFEHRRWLVAGSANQAVAELRSLADRGPARIPPGTVAPIAFLFPGQGSQFVQMTAGLYAAEPTFRAQLDLCCELLRPLLGLDLREILFPKSGKEEGTRTRLNQTAITQPALFAVEYSLAQMFIGWGVRPAAMFGHSIGEYVAACVAGVMSLDDAISLVAQRGSLIQKCPPGVMLAVQASDSEVSPLLIAGVEVAAVNSPLQTVVSGTAERISDLEQSLTSHGLKHRRLVTSHAFHSALLDGAVDSFRTAVAKVPLKSPSVRFVSCVTGMWITDAQATDPGYWVSQLRQPVQCRDALSTLAADGAISLLELGAGTTLVNFARPCISRDRLAAVCGGLPRDGGGETEWVLQSLGQLWEAGAHVDWATFHSLAKRHRIHLPTYPFERKRYWIEPPERAGNGEWGSGIGERKRDDATEPATLILRVEPTIRELSGTTLADLQGVFAELGGMSPSAIEPESTFLELGFDSLFLTQGVQAIQLRFGVRVSFRQLLEGLDTPTKLAAFLESKRPTQEAVSVESPQSAAAPVKTESVGFGSLAPLDRSTESDWSPAQIEFVDALVRRVIERTVNSKRHVQDFRREHADPRTVSGFTRLWKEIVYPIVVDRSAGSRLWDIDGNEYIDLLNGFGPDLLGHSPPYVVEAVTKQLAAGYEVGPLAPQAGELARLVCSLTGMDRASFVCTGSEAVQAALRAARTVTGRDKVVTFARDYHGNFDEVLLRPNPSDGAKPASPSVPGVPNASVSNVIVLEYGTDASLEVIRQLGTSLAAVLVEPVQSRRPELQPREFLHQLRKITEACGAALIFDEVITGFRLHPGGAQAFFDVRADIATYGKIIGGGMPIGAVAGRARYMDAFDGGWWQFGDDSFPEAGRTFFAGTFVRHPLALAAGVAALKHVVAEGPALQEQLNSRADKLVAALNQATRAAGVPLEVVNCGSLMFFRILQNSKEASLLFYLLRAKGIYILEGFPSYLSTAHSDADLLAIENAFRDSIAEMRAAGFFGTPTDDGLVPLTAAQSELWLAAQLGDDASRAFNESCMLRLRGSFDVEAFRNAISQLVQRHEALRAVFDVSGAGQRFLDRVEIELPLVDLRGSTDPEAALSKLQEAEDGFVFDLATGPLLRARVVRLADDDHAVLLTVHHIACDGWSYDILLHELGTLYSAIKAGRGHKLLPADRFRNYAESRSERGASAKERAYWKSLYEQSPTPLDLPSRQRPAKRTFSGTRLTHRLGAERTAAIKQLATRLGCTSYATLLAAFEVLLHRLAGQNDVILGIPTAGQARAGINSLVGHCVNFLPLRQEVNPERSFSSFAGDVKANLLAALDHGDFTYVELLRDLPQGDPAQPLVGTGFNLDPLLTDLGFDGLKCRVAKNPKHFVNLELHWNLVDEGSEFVLEAEYNTDLFDTATIQRWADYYCHLLDSAVTDTDVPVAQLPMVSDAEEKRVLVVWNATSTPYPDRAIHELFAEQAYRNPSATALLFGDTTMSYGDLDARANQVAQALHARGVGVDCPVAVQIPRSPDLIVALLAVLKAGGAYLPLDEAHPPARRAQLLADSGATAVIARHCDSSAFPPGIAFVPIDGTYSNITSPLPNVTADHMAAVLYTSGSTGRPKGVMVTHRGMSRLLFNSGICEFGPDHTFAFLAPVAFDAATFEIWGALVHGARLAIYPDAVPDPSTLGEFLRKNQVDTLWLTAGLFNAVVDLDVSALAGVRQLLTGGEAMSLVHARRARAALSKTYIINGYGPTEATTFATTFRLPGEIPDDWTSIPIGKPIGNTGVFVLNSRRQPVPIGITGELYIGGPGVARGYLNDPTLTRERFIPSPIPSSPGTLYRTGDRVRWHDDGTLEYLGRFDDQVKIRGHRIEPSEVESILAVHGDVASCAVVPRGSGVDARLVAYVVPRLAAPRDPVALAKFLGERLPAYLVPAQFMFIDSLPLTANGKLDRAALPETSLVSHHKSRERVAPRIDAERELLPIWSEVLGVPDLGITDDFFGSGGHSLKAITLVSAVRRRLGHSLPLGALYQAPTVESFARLIQEQLEAGTDTSIVPLHETGTRPPLFMVAGVGGHVFAFHKFARLLGADQPTYGVKAIGVDGTRATPDSVEEIAAEYVREMIAVRPNGPYMLTGYSLGAVLALEVALHLRALGHAVPLIVAYDASAPGYLSYSVLRRARLHFSNLFLRGGGWGYLKQRFSNLKGKMNWQLGRGHKNAPAIEGLEMFSQKAITDVWVALNQAYHKYQPSRKFDGQIVVFRAAVLDDWDKFVSNDPNLGWSRWAASVESQSLPVRHLDMFQEPAIGDLARRTDEAIRKYGRR